MKLTLKQLQVYDYILTCLDQGFTPTHSQIQKKFNWKSSGTPDVYIKLLKKKGYLVDKPGRIQIIKK